MAVWRHAEVFNAVLAGGTFDHLDMPRHKVSWHLIWLFSEGYITFDENGKPIPRRVQRHVSMP